MVNYNKRLLGRTLPRTCLCIVVVVVVVSDTTPDVCIYLYFFAYFYFSLTTFRTFKYTISNNSTLASPVQQKKQQTHHNPICATRDFTAVAFLRQISIITKLLFFSALGRKTANPSSYCWWRVIFCIFCFLLLFLLAPSSSTFSCCRPETLISFFLFS